MALEKGKTVIFMNDTDPRHGGMTIEKLLAYAVGQLKRAAEDKKAGVSNVANSCTRKLSPRQCAAERAVAEALVVAGAARRASPTALEQAQRAVADATAERDASVAEAKLVLDQHGGAPADWQTTEGELLVEWLQLLLPTVLDLAHANGRPVIPWYRDAHCKRASLKRIMQETLAASFGTEHFLDTKCDSAECARCDGTVPRPAVHSAGALPALCIAGEASRRRVRLPAHTLHEEEGASHHLFLSPHHPASAALQQNLQQRLPGLKCSEDIAAACTHMLVVLDAGSRGNAQADSCALNHEGYRQDILAGMERGMEPIILHVGAVPFEAYTWDKGAALWETGLLDTVAIPAPEAVLLAKPGAARENRELVATALGRVGLKIALGEPPAGPGRLLLERLQWASAAVRDTAGKAAAACRRLRRARGGFKAAGTVERGTSWMGNPMFTELTENEGSRAAADSITVHPGASGSSRTDDVVV